MEMFTRITVKCHFKVSFVNKGMAIFSLVKKEKMRKKSYSINNIITTGSFSWIKTY